MMDDELYEGWFGIPFKEIEQEQINKLRNDLIENNNNNLSKNSFNTFLNKKRANKIYLYESNSTFDPNNSYENNEEEKEDKSKVNSENEETLINIENIIIPENIIENNKGIILKNKNIFCNSKDNYYNGVFCLLSKYLEERESNSIFAKQKLLSFNA